MTNIKENSYHPMPAREWRGFLKSLAVVAFLVLFVTLGISDGLAYLLHDKDFRSERQKFMDTIPETK